MLDLAQHGFGSIDDIEAKIIEYTGYIVCLDNEIAISYAPASFSDDDMSEDENGLEEYRHDALSHMYETPLDSNYSEIENAEAQGRYSSEDKFPVVEDTPGEEDVESVLSNLSDMPIDPEFSKSENLLAEVGYSSHHEFAEGETLEENYDNEVAKAENPSAECGYSSAHELSVQANRITSTTLPLKTPGFIRFGPYNRYVLSLYLRLFEQLSRPLFFKYQEERGNSYQVWGM